MDTLPSALAGPSPASVTPVVSKVTFQVKGNASRVESTPKTLLDLARASASHQRKKAAIRECSRARDRNGRVSFQPDAGVFFAAGNASRRSKASSRAPEAAPDAAAFVKPDGYSAVSARRGRSFSAVAGLDETRPYSEPRQRRLPRGPG